MSKHMQTFLVTGFEPFNKSNDNPSARAIEQLSPAAVPGARVVTGLLPVSVRRALRILRRLLQSHSPEFVLLLGEMRGSPCLRVERIAINLLEADIPDNDGHVLTGRSIVPAGPTAYWTTLPHKTMLAAARAAGAPCVQSLSAGAYLCNQMLYLALHAARAAGNPMKVGFVHLPSLPGQMQSADAPKPTMDLGLSTRAITAVLTALVKSRGS